MEHKLLTIREVADRWQVSIRTITRLVESGDLKAVRVSDRYRFAPSDLQDYLDRRGSQKEGAAA